MYSFLLSDSSMVSMHAGRIANRFSKANKPISKAEGKRIARTMREANSDKEDVV